MRSGGVFDATVIDEASGFASILLRGDVAPFLNEAGGHRWQRIPRNEKRGRVHTSTVTVAVLTLSESSVTSLNPRDVEITTTRGSGPGGQHRNTTDSCVLATHRPTGITVRIDGRSQHQNRRVAMAVLAERIAALARAHDAKAENVTRREQVGSGERGDKIRTYRMRDNIVNDHRTGRKMRLDLWLRGDE